MQVVRLERVVQRSAVGIGDQAGVDHPVHEINGAESRVAGERLPQDEGVVIVGGETEGAFPRNSDRGRFSGVQPPRLGAERSPPFPVRVVPGLQPNGERELLRFED